MSALATTVRQLSGRLALLRAERERYQALCAAAYQLAGTVNAPVRFLDAFSDGANGEIEARQKTDDLLPVDPKETGAFPAWSDENVVAMEAELAQLREELKTRLSTIYHLEQAVIEWKTNAEGKEAEVKRLGSELAQWKFRAKDAEEYIDEKDY